ncbi:hypothetical protein D3C71_918320 [compost metagenome]
MTVRIAPIKAVPKPTPVIIEPKNKITALVKLIAKNKTLAPIMMDKVPVSKIRKFVDFLRVNMPAAPESASAINIIPFNHAEEV